MISSWFVAWRISIITHEFCLSETIHCVVCVTIAHTSFADEPISTLRVHLREWLWEAPVSKQIYENHLLFYVFFSPWNTTATVLLMLWNYFSNFSRALVLLLIWKSVGWRSASRLLRNAMRIVNRSACCLLLLDAGRYRFKIRHHLHVAEAKEYIPAPSITSRCNLSCLKLSFNSMYFLLFLYSISYHVYHISPLMYVPTLARIRDVLI